ncbi:MAG TPA: hypothetical protein H9668_01145 [Firmicutes bacterium]|nr:hypothetical protein [Bacillota bacterium]
MAVWGIGANWDKRDVSREFVGYSTASIGYDEKDNSTFHDKMKKVNVGDLIFIKAKFMEKGTMLVKAIGIVTDKSLCLENGFDGHEGIKVHWVRNLTDNPVEIISPGEYGSTHTFYEEKDKNVIKRIIDLL